MYQKFAITKGSQKRYGDFHRGIEVEQLRSKDREGAAERERRRINRLEKFSTEERKKLFLEVGQNESTVSCLPVTEFDRAIWTPSP